MYNCLLTMTMVIHKITSVNKNSPLLIKSFGVPHLKNKHTNFIKMLNR